jgi:phage terminase large subunit
MEITIPYKFVPRNYQQVIFDKMDAGFKRIIQVWHRRAGKEKTDINIVAREVYSVVGAYYYVFPTYNQGKKVLWNGADKDGVRFLDHFPEATRKRTVGNEMFIEFKNGSTFQVVGSDNVDSIVGTNPLGVVFSEYSLQDPRTWDFIRPILAENGGWAIFNFTPRGENHAKELLDYAKTDPNNWFVSVLSVDDTGALSREVLEQERNEITAKNGDDAIFLQEYYNSFSASAQGSYYGKLIERMENDGRVTSVPYEANLPVHTWWDLGVNDSMSIGFFQKHGLQWRLIDYIEGSGEGLGYYVTEMQSKGYVYGKHYAPHDIAVKELGSGLSRLETAKSLGITFETKTTADGKISSVVPMLSVEDGIQAVRSRISSLWIDGEKCKRVISALKNYHKDYDETNKVYRNNPKHDWSSHCFTGDTKILTRSGIYQIMELDDKHLILTPNGWKKFKQLGITQRNAKLVEVKFSDNTRVKCTQEHLFLTESGWKSAKHLQKGLKIQSSLTVSRAISMVSYTAYGLMRSIFQIMEDFIEKFGKRLLEKYQTIVIYIIKMAIQKIIVLKTSNVLTGANISKMNGKNTILAEDLMTPREKTRLGGTNQKKEGYGTAEWQQENRAGLSGKKKQENAYFVIKNLRELYGIMGILKNSVIQIVRPLTIESVTKLKYKEDVYDINVPIEHCFSLINGAVVHNCADMVRYWAVTPDTIGAENLEQYNIPTFRYQ